MFTNTQIVGFCLIKNEEFFIGQVLKNISSFCDKIIIADNLSTDNTFDIVTKISLNDERIKVHSLQNRANSQQFIEEYVGTPSWIFGVDGDEIYDPVGLELLRNKILEGEYNENVQLYGNVLNCSFIDLKGKIAKGYLAPPCRSMTKLYNFQLIEDWSDPGAERLHGEVIYKKGYSKLNSLNLHEQFSWEDSFFRCLHLCFLRRSSVDTQRKQGNLFARTSGVDLSQGGFRVRIKRYIFSLFKIHEQSTWKIDKYKRGEFIEKSVESFLN